MVTVTEEWQTIRRGPPPQAPSPSLPPTRIPYIHHQPTRRRPKPQPPASNTVAAISHLVSRQRETTWWASIVDLLRTAVGARRVRALHCLGLGSFAASANARHQLAFAMLLRELTEAGECTVADPAMGVADEDLIRDLGFQVSPVKGFNIKRNAADEVVMMFMPHCGKALNEEALRMSEEVGHGSVIFLANLFSGYLDRGRPDVTSYIHRLYTKGALEERLFPDAKDSTRETAFNDLALTMVKA